MVKSKWAQIPNGLDFSLFIKFVDSEPMLKRHLRNTSGHWLSNVTDAKKQHFNSHMQLGLFYQSVAQQSLMDLQ